MNSEAKIETFSQFGGFWIDRKNAESVLTSKLRSGQISPELGNQISAFMRDGYIVIKAAVAKALVFATAANHATAS